MGLHRLGNYLSQQIWNDNAAAIERFASAVGGRGVASGLELSAGDGLQVEVSAGLVVTGGSARQTALIYATVPPSNSKYVWVDEEGTIAFSDSASDLGGSNVCLGRVFSDADSITSVTTEGRCEIARWTSLRTYSLGQNLLVLDTETGRVGIGMEPTVAFEVSGSARFSSEVSADRVLVRSRVSAPSGEAGAATLCFSGGELKAVQSGEPAVSLTRGFRPVSFGWASRSLVLSDDLTLGSTDAPIQALQAGGADREIRLPAVADVDWGTWFRILNVGSSDDLVVKSFDGSTTLATLAPGQFVEALPVALAGSPVWPSSLAVQTMASSEA